MNKRRKPKWIEPLLWDWPTLTPRGCTFLFLLNKTLSYNQVATLVCSFNYLLQQDRTEEIIHSPDISVAITRM